MRTGWIALPLIAIAGLGACDGLSFHLDCTENPDICQAPDGGGGLAEAGPDVVVPAGCDLTKSPKDSPECVTDTVGVFVSPTGKDGAAGTKADPLKSIAEAVTRGFPRVYVCEGTYDAPVTIAQPVAIFGGFSCAWAPADVKAKLAPPKGIALKITKVTSAVRIEDLDVLGSADASTLGDSATAAFVSESGDVTFKNATLTAGAGTKGEKGAPGTSRSNYTGGTATVGGTGSAAIGGEGATCTCVDATSSKGGRGAAGNGAGITPGTSSPSVDTPNVNDGSSSSTTCADGTAGANGPPGAAGQPSSAAGILTASGWSAAPTPTPAGNGKPAQGGGGGGAKTGFATAGRGGGCGGCGGAGGDPGTSGGSSFALLSFQSTVTIEGGVLESGAAGGGGDGGDGQDGQGGGGGGGAGGCAGGAGGAGAGGSGGGGGAGGHSVPIGFVGTEPRVNAATLKPGIKGGLGAGGKAGLGPGNAGKPGTPGPEGKAQNTLAL